MPSHIRCTKLLSSIGLQQNQKLSIEFALDTSFAKYIRNAKQVWHICICNNFISSLEKNSKCNAKWYDFHFKEIKSVHEISFKS